MNKQKLYWLCQLGGWLFFIVLNSLFIKLNNAFTGNVALSMSFFFSLGVLFTHLYRNLIIELGWLNIKIIALIPRVIISTLLLAIIFEYTQHTIELLFNIAGNKHKLSIDVATNILNIAFVFFFWSLIYFLFHYIENYKKAEIENLKWEASINEIELNKLKSQLNPHFIFNAMNSIRALVDENPEKSKEAINQLSNILRNTLLMGKNKTISFDEEFKIVTDYLALETIRYEERLVTKFDIANGSSSFSVPPLMIQTLVENGIKHGIAKLTQGGTLELITKVEDDKLIIKIRNNGELRKETDSSNGFGLKNTVQRLKLLYGNDASLTIVDEEKNVVLTKIVIPNKTIINKKN